MQPNNSFSAPVSSKTQSVISSISHCESQNSSNLGIVDIKNVNAVFERNLSAYSSQAVLNIATATIYEAKNEEDKFSLLNECERAAIASYIIRSEPLNLSLIKGNLHEDDELVQLDRDLTSAFKKMPTNQKKVVYKGLRGIHKGLFLCEGEIGKKVTAPYYFSTTESLVRAKEFAINNILLKITGFSGVKINYDALDNEVAKSRDYEKEILFNKNTSFVVENITQLDGFCMFELRELPSSSKEEQLELNTRA